MSTPEYSDEQTIDRYSSPNLQHLISQNKMKDLALAKATNLIELLNIELQVERNTTHESVRRVQVQLERKYQAEIQFLKEKIQLLQLNISQGNKQSRSMEKGRGAVDATVRKATFLRASSVRSFDNRKKQSVGKKYTQNNTNQQCANNNQTASIMICDKVFKSQMLQLQDWKQSIFLQLDKLVKEQYEELNHLINSIEKCSEDFQQIAHLKKDRTGRNLIAEMGSVVREQQNLINTWRAYSQELEDLHKSYFFKMQSIMAQTPKIECKWEPQIPQMVEVIRESILGGKREWGRRVSGLEHENEELKYILDNMIRLVKEEKKIKS